MFQVVILCPTLPTRPKRTAPSFIFTPFTILVPSLEPPVLSLDTLLGTFQLIYIINLY